MTIKSNISLADARLEGAVVQVIKGWAMAFPTELVAFDKQQKELRARLHRKNGMAGNGTLLHKFEIPVTLNQMMNIQFGIRWRDDRKIRRYFFDNFEIGRVGRCGPGGGKAWMRVS